MQNCFSFFTVAIYLGYSLKNSTQPLRHHASRAKLLTPLLLIFIFLSGAARVYAWYVEGDDGASAERLAKSCMLYPDCWEVCVRAADAYSVENEPRKAQAIAWKTIENHPNQFQALKIHADSSFKLNDVGRACQSMAAYKLLVGNSDGFEENFLTACGIK